MKKVLLFALLAIGLLAVQEGKSQKYLQYPWADADYQANTLGATVTADTVTITNSFTYINYTTARGAALAINVEIDEGVKRGALLVIKVLSDGTGRNTTFGYGIDGPTLSGTASKTKTALFFYDGTTFLALSVGTQLD